MWERRRGRKKKKVKVKEKLKAVENKRWKIKKRNGIKKQERE